MKQAPKSLMGNSGRWFVDGQEVDPTTGNVAVDTPAELTPKQKKEELTAVSEDERTRREGEMRRRLEVAMDGGQRGDATPERVQEALDHFAIRRHVLHAAASNPAKVATAASALVGMLEADEAHQKRVAERLHEIAVDQAQREVAELYLNKRPSTIEDLLDAQKLEA